jgi:hypothetical protein
VRLRLILAAALTAGLGVFLAAGAVSGGAERDTGGPLGWVATPETYVAEGLPGDRVMRGWIENRSLERRTFTSRTVRLVDARGRDLRRATAAFLATYMHGLYPTDRTPGDLSDFERERTGLLVKLDPGERVPVTLAWRVRDGVPARIAYPGGTLEIPPG